MDKILAKEQLYYLSKALNMSDEEFEKQYAEMQGVFSKLYFARCLEKMSEEDVEKLKKEIDAANPPIGGSLMVKLDQFVSSRRDLGKADIIKRCQYDAIADFIKKLSESVVKNV